MIQEKRDSLEHFLHEQLIGPGGCNYQFKVFNEKEDENLKEFSAGEVVNTTPGSIYNSAILFPQQDDKEQGVYTGPEDEGTPNDPQDDEDPDSPDSTEDEEAEDEKNIDFGEDIDALGRRFPNRFGVSCCLQGEDINKDLHIRITGRFYKKVKEDLSVRIKVTNVEDLTNFINSDEFKKKFDNLISIDDGYIKILKGIKDSDLRDYNDRLRELNKFYCQKVATNPDGSLCPIFNEASFKPEYRFLSAYKEKLFAFLTNVDENGNYACNGQEDSIKERIAEVEKYETCISYIEDVFSVFNSRDFGFWQAFEFDKELDLSNIDLTSKRVFKADEYPALKEIVKYEIRQDVNLSLNVWLQVLKYGDKYYLKVLLENKSTSVKKNEVKYFSIVTEKVNERCFFGVKVDISSPNLVPYHRENKYEANDAEANMLRFLYRDIKDYGVGHLCSVDWKKDENGTLHVFSEFMPTIESPDVEPEPRNKKQEITKEDGTIEAKKYLDDTQFLQFKKLSVFSDLTNEQIKNGLLEFVEKYHQWIDGLSVENELAQSNIKKCKDDYERIKRNISDFLSDDSKMLSFRLMNAAMFMQLWHNTDKNKEIVRTQHLELTFAFYRDKADDRSIFKDSSGNGIPAAWRPFQLAFILLNLDGIFQRDLNGEWKERNEKVDLVWFPTGGGKTEAYLGIIALTIINRRRTFGNQGYGTAALMRYTLRLLATQQFQRALRLILALEQIRRWENAYYKLGDDEISIGLYVGSGSLPNTNKDLKDEVNKWKGKDHGRIPLDTCPWCGAEIETTNNGKDVAFECSEDTCTYGGFENYYPVRLCDEHIYKNPPTLLFGTVDKFAQLAHKVENAIEKDSRRIFGNGQCLPPDLIIQDELHLLLGPLGSAVALYENAIDQLCSRTDNNGHIIRPKIISSTATTRNTSLQIRALYDRDVSIFPKNGIDYDDSFFAFYKRFKNEGDTDWTYIAKRKYIGILPTGRTSMTTQLRLAAILFVHRALFELEHIDQLKEDKFVKAADYYYTIISYFNSLKEVGKTDAQFYQEFTKFTRRLFKRVLRYSNMLECFYAYNTHFQKSELTGRLSGQEAVEALSVAQNLKWSPSNRLPSPNGNGTWTKAKLPADMVLATNMISVGLDVARFNTIIMNSMPRNIAEYIQASSRVARSEKGLVLTLHSPFNQRDVSHFEKFREFHEKLYYYVEPISITPFSPKSVARFLPLYLAAYIRHKYVKVSTRTDAKFIDQQLADKIKDDIKQFFNERMSRTKDTDEAALLTDDMLQEIYNEIDRNINNWLDVKGVNGKNLVYIKNQYNSEEVPLFSSPEDFEGDIPSDKWLVPNALRVIEPESVIHVIR